MNLLIFLDINNTFAKVTIIFHSCKCFTTKCSVLLYFYYKRFLKSRRNLAFVIIVHEHMDRTKVENAIKWHKY